MLDLYNEGRPITWLALFLLEPKGYCCWLSILKKDCFEMSENRKISWKNKPL
jgi:hypothetical protein